MVPALASLTALASGCGSYLKPATAAVGVGGSHDAGGDGAAPTPQPSADPGDDGDAPAGGDATPTPSPAPTDAPDGGGGGPGTSLGAFKDTVYPLARAYCADGGCHSSTQGPLFAVDDVAAAHKALLDSGKVDLVDVDRSRLFLRLSADNHHCWTDCANDAAVMHEALAAWAAFATADGAQPTPPPSMMSAPLLYKDAVERDSGVDASVIAFEAESGTLAAPMVATADAGRSGGKFIQVPTGNAVNNANTANIGSVVFSFDVKVAGTYNVWALANAPAANANRIFMRLDAGQFATWTMPVNAAAYTWIKATGAGNTPVAVALAAGKHTLEFRRSTSKVKLDQIAVTSLASFDGTQIKPAKVNVLRFDLSGVAKKAGVALELEMALFNDGAYKFRNPKLVVDSGSVHVKGLHLTINGKTDPQVATYARLDATVAAPGAVLSTAAMVAVKDTGEATDEIAVSFDALEVK
jgi:hypothetical protein